MSINRLLIFIISFLVNILNAEAHYQADCKILNEEGKLLFEGPGRMCIFFDNGEFIFGTFGDLTYINSDGGVRWKIYLRTHHQMKLSKNGKQVVVLSENTHSFLGVPARFEALKIVNLNNGKVEKDFDLYQIFKQLGLTGPVFRRTYNTFEPNYALDTTHLNSFDVIHKSEYLKIKFNFNEGDLLVNVYPFGKLVVLDQDSGKLKWIKDISSYAVWVHDIQLLPSDEILLYINKTEDKLACASKLVKFLPEADAKKFADFEIPLRIGENHFCQMIGGSAQQLDQRKYLISTFTEKEGYGFKTIADSKDQEKVKYPAPTDKGPALFYQDIRKIDLSHFLKNYKLYEKH